MDIKESLKKLTDFEKRVILEYYRRNKNTLKDKNPLELLKASLFEEQSSFIFDENELSMACCTRRAGKSHACAVGLLTAALQKPSSECLYIGLTRLASKNIMQPNIERLLKKYEIEYEYYKSELRFVLKNNSQIVLTGVGDSVKGIQKLLGVAYDLVVIDEAQSFPSHIRELVHEVLLITIAERKGKIRLIGTPSMIASGFFYNVFNNMETLSQWSTHSWSWTQNEAVRDLIQEQIDRMLKVNPLIKETPAYKRNYLGEWVADSDNLVYRFNPLSNLISSSEMDMRLYCTHYVLAVDLGFVDATAFCVIGWGPHDPRVFVLESYKASGLIPSDIVKLITGYHDKYQNQIIKTVVDEGGLGKSIAEEWRRRYKVAVTPAKKTDKRLFIEHINGLFIDKSIQIIAESNAELIEELKNLVWLDKERRHEHPACENHLCDSLLYSVRESLSYLWTPEEKIDPIKEQEHKLLESHRRAVSLRSQSFDSDLITDASLEDGWH